MWQKNVSATSELIGAVVDPGGVVLDPCCGAGTAGLAAIGHGCRFIGIDVDSLAVKAARAALAAADGRSVAFAETVRTA